MRMVKEIAEEIKPLPLQQKLDLIKLIADMIGNSEDFSDLIRASESSIDFWKNDIDSEVWNNA